MSRYHDIFIKHVSIDNVEDYVRKVVVCPNTNGEVNAPLEEKMVKSFTDLIVGYIQHRYQEQNDWLDVDCDYEFDENARQS